MLAVLALGCGEKPTRALDHPAAPADSQAFAERLVAVLAACDRPAIDATIDVRALATRAARSEGASESEAARFTDVAAGAWADLQVCGRGWEFVLVRASDDGKASRPMIRWSDSGELGYVELIVRKAPDRPAELFDFVGVLGERSVLAELAKIYAVVLPRDQPGMVADALSIPLHVGLPLASGVLEDEMNREPGSMRPLPPGALGWMIVQRAFLDHAYADVPPILNLIEHRVGTDALLSGLRAAALIGLDDPFGALVAARGACALAPDSRDGWVVLLHTQVATGDLVAAKQTFDALSSRFDYTAAQVRATTRLQPLAALLE